MFQFEFIRTKFMRKDPAFCSFHFGFCVSQSNNYSTERALYPSLSSEYRCKGLSSTQAASFCSHLSKKHIQIQKQKPNVTISTANRPQHIHIDSESRTITPLTTMSNNPAPSPLNSFNFKKTARPPARMATRTNSDDRYELIESGLGLGGEGNVNIDTIIEESSTSNHNPFSSAPNNTPSGIVLARLFIITMISISTISVTWMYRVEIASNQIPYIVAIHWVLIAYYIGSTSNNDIAVCIKRSYQILTNQNQESNDHSASQHQTIIPTFSPHGTTSLLPNQDCTPL